MIENVSTQLTVFHCFAHCLLPGRAFASLYALLFLEKEAEIGGRAHMRRILTLMYQVITHFWLPWGRSRLLQRCGRVFAFRSCGPGSIFTSGGLGFSTPCDIRWPVWGSTVCISGIRMDCLGITACLRADSGTSLFKAGKYVIGISSYCLAVEVGFDSDVVECLPFRSNGPGSIPTSCVWYFSAPCDIWWLSLGLWLVVRHRYGNVPEL